MSTERSVAVVIFSLVFVMLGGVAFAAHHFRTGYESERTITLTGVVNSGGEIPTPSLSGR